MKHTINGGDTMAVTFHALDGRKVAILLPRKAASDLKACLTDFLDQSPRRDNNLSKIKVSMSDESYKDIQLYASMRLASQSIRKQIDGHKSCNFFQ